MKKVLNIFIILICFVSFIGCKEQEIVDKPDDKPKENISYVQYFEVQHIQSVSLFDGLYTLDTTQIKDYVKKKSIFDQDVVAGVTLFQINLFSSESGSTNQNQDFRYEAFRRFHYMQRLTHFPAYMVCDYSPYLSQEFLEEVLKLEKGEITPQEIFNVYGTHTLLAIIEGFYFDSIIKVDTQDLTEEEYSFILEYIMYYKTGKYSQEKIDAFHELSKKCNIDVKVTTTFIGDDYFEVLDKINSQQYEYINTIHADGLLSLWYVLPEKYSVAKKMLQDAYALLKTNE